MWKSDINLSLFSQNVCSTLWCSVGTTCHSKLDGAVDGTSCGEGKVKLLIHDHERIERESDKNPDFRFCSFSRA